MATTLEAEVSAHMRDYLRQALSHFVVRVSRAEHAMATAREMCMALGFMNANGTLLTAIPHPPAVMEYKDAVIDWVAARDGETTLRCVVTKEWLAPAWAQRFVGVMARRLHDEDTASGLGDPVGLADDYKFVAALNDAWGPIEESPVVPLGEDGEPIYPAASAEYVPPPPARVVTRAFATGGRRPAAAPGSLHWH